jgi:hypothetical protein
MISQSFAIFAVVCPYVSQLNILLIDCKGFEREYSIFGKTALVCRKNIVVFLFGWFKDLLVWSREPFQVEIRATQCIVPISNKDDKIILEKQSREYNDRMNFHLRPCLHFSTPNFFKHTDAGVNDLENVLLIDLEPKSGIWWCRAFKITSC